jgi:hypothetical protein
MVRQPNERRRQRHDGMQSVPRGAGGRTGVSIHIGKGIAVIIGIFLEMDCCHGHFIGI